MLGWGGGDVNVPCTCTHVGCYARCWVGVGVDVNVPSNHKTFWKNFKKIWRSKSKCQNASSFRVHKKRTFVIKHNRMALAKREYQWNCAEKSRAAAWTPKTNGNTDSKLRKIQAMYWKHHGRLHTVYLVRITPPHLNKPLNLYRPFGKGNIPGSWALIHHGYLPLNVQVMGSHRGQLPQLPIM